MKVPDPKRSIEAQDEDVLLAMCIFGEARNQPPEAMRAVANVVRNRLANPRAYGQGWREVINKKRAFSCFNPSDPNREKLLRPLDWEKPQTWARCWEAARQVYEGIAADNTLGATHYFDDSLKERPPRWAKLYTPTVKIGALLFLRASRNDAG